MKTKPKSPSQTMRAILYRLWEQDHETHSDFETYYAEKIGQLNEWLKSKLK